MIQYGRRFLRSNLKKWVLKAQPWRVLLPIFIMLVLASVILPSVAAAQQVSFPYWPSERVPLLPCTGLNCVSLCQLLTLLQHLVYFGMTLAVEIIAPVFFIWGAFLLLISAGSEERLSKGKKVLTSTILGVVITLGAFLIVNTFLWLLGNPASGGVSWPNVACEAPTLPQVGPAATGGQTGGSGSKTAGGGCKTDSDCITTEYCDIPLPAGSCTGEATCPPPQGVCKPRQAFGGGESGGGGATRGW